MSHDPTQLEPTGRRPAPAVPEVAPASVLDLVNRTLADTTRTANAATIIAVAAKGAARVVLTVGLLVIATAILASLLIHFAGLGPELGTAIAAGGMATVAGGRYLWNRRPATRRTDSSRRRTT